MIAVIFQGSLKGISVTHTFGGVLWPSSLTFILCLWQLLIIVFSLLLDVQVDICSTREEEFFFPKSSFSDDTRFFCYMCCGIWPHHRNATLCFMRVEQDQLST